MLELVGNLKDRFSRDAAHLHLTIVPCILTWKTSGSSDWVYNCLLNCCSGSVGLKLGLDTAGGVGTIMTFVMCPEISQMANFKINTLWCKQQEFHLFQQEFQCGNK